MRCAACGHEGSWTGPCPLCSAGPPASAGFVVRKAPAAGTYLWPCVATTLLCCLPFGALGIVFSLRARSRTAAGEWAEAQRAHGLSKVFFWCAVAAGLGALLLLGVLSFAVGGTQLEVGEAEQALCLRAQDLADWGYAHPDPAPLEKFVLTRNALDDSLELEYQFETPQGESRWPLYLCVMGSVEEKASDAVLTEQAYKVGLMIGLGGNSVTRRPLQGLPRLGEASEAVELVLQGRRIGAYYCARKGGRVYLILATGEWLADPELFETEVAPRIEAFWDYRREE